jgi:hypothetical protein
MWVKEIKHAIMDGTGFANPKPPLQTHHGKKKKKNIANF